MLVSWRPPDDGAVVRGYVVGYGEGVPDVSWQYLEPHRRNVTISNLSQYYAGLLDIANAVLKFIFIYFLSDYFKR